MPTDQSENKSIATLGGGCFWCLEAVFQRIKGVSAVVSGYTGGEMARANYKSVCQGDTGIAEVIQITFDSETVSFEQLLDVYFASHDPTTLNRQGADVGTQYRSEIFCHDDAQLKTATEKIAGMNESGKYKSKIVTVVSSLGQFIAAEDYHQGYFNANPYQGYCMGVVMPKVQKAYQLFPDLMIQEE